MPDKFLNVDMFGLPLTIIFFAGCTLWVVAYGITIINIHKNKFVEIPVVGACANLAWEFIWSFPFGYMVASSMGTAILWGYRVWFFMDLYIFYNLLMHGSKQFATMELRRYFKPITVVMLLMWVVGFYWYAWQGLDTPIGSVTAYYDNLPLSGLYIVLVLSQADVRLFSKTVAWTKGAGTGLVSIALSIHWSDNHWLQTLCAVTLILDICYLYAFHYKRKQAGLA